jgi:hypothetical protein
MLIFDLGGSSHIQIDHDLVTKDAARMGQEGYEMWNQIVAKAKAEFAKHK